MIFAVADRAKRELVIAGADTVDAHRAFVSRVVAISPELLQDTDFTRFLVDRDLSRFKITPTIFEFSTAEDIDEFVAAHEGQIEIISFDNAVDRQRGMIAASDFVEETGRTIGEITGLNEHDPFDLRTDEEKAEQEKKWAEAKKKRKAGDMTGDSFGGGMGGGIQPDRLTKQLVGEPGTYFQVAVNQTLGNSAADITKMYTEESGRERIKVPFEPVFSEDILDDAGVRFFFKDQVVAEVVADDLRDVFTHVAEVTVTKVDECGNPLEDADDEGGINIRDIKISVDPETGEVTIERVLADKDLFKRDYYKIIVNDDAGAPLVGKEAYEPLLKRAGLADTNRYFGADYRVDPEGGILIKLGGASLQRMKEALASSDHTMVYVSGKEDDGVDNPLKIADDDMVAVYFRVEAPEVDVQMILDMLNDDNKPKPYRSANFAEAGGGCWLAYVRRASAEEVVDYLVAKSIPAEIAEVDRTGTRIIEEGTVGVTVVDTGAADIEPPLPWNEGADEFAKMDEKAQRKALAGRWLLYTLRKYPYPTGLIVHITPKSYFNREGKMWDGELPIGHLLTDNFEKFGDIPGVYQCKSLDMNPADFLLGNKAGMKESLALRMHVNLLGENAF